MSKKKLIASILFFLALIFATFYVIFSQNNMSEIIETITSINHIYILIAILLIVLYFISQGIYMKLLLKTLNIKISLIKGIFYSIVEFFFSAITPSSTGGQPVQLYYMTKDKISAEKALIVLILNTIIFKLFLIVFGFIIIIFDRELIFNNTGYTSILFWLGMIVDIAVVTFCYFLMFNKKLVENIIALYYKAVQKITKKNINYEEKINKLVKKYSNNAEYIKNHQKDVFVGTVITFIQRILMFSITFVVYLSLGLKGISYFELLLLQIFTQITIEGLPLPGGTGALEAITNNVYMVVFGNLAMAGTLLTRTFSFYLPIFITMISIILVTKIHYMKKK